METSKISPLAPIFKSFKLTDFVTKDEAFHIARVYITSRNDISYHSHDYAELLWVEEGEGIHYINGYKVPIKKNEMIMIRPQDKHTFSSKGKGLTIVNIAFSQDTLEHFRHRYFSETNLYFWTTNDLPFKIVIPEKVISKISLRAEEAMRFKRSNIQLDSLLLFIFRNIQEYGENHDYSKTPVWLVSAIKRYNHADYFKLGAKSFVELCDRNSDYVNRVIKEQFNQTLTEFVNNIRIKHAADQLILTNIPIKLISHLCGFDSLAYFYKQFFIRYGQTPLDYRKLNQSVV